MKLCRYAPVSADTALEKSHKHPESKLEEEITAHDKKPITLDGNTVIFTAYCVL